MMKAAFENPFCVHTISSFEISMMRSYIIHDAVRPCVGVAHTVGPPGHVFHCISHNDYSSSLFNRLDDAVTINHIGADLFDECAK